MNYKSSHSAQGYGSRYAKTYSEGYYYHQWLGIEKNLIIKLFEKYTEKNHEYLDFACGTGRILNVAEKYFKRTTGVDVSATMLDEAKKVCSSSNLIMKDISTESINGEFNVITAFRFFLNAESQLRHDVLNELHSYLLDDGTLICNIHTNSSSPMGLAYRLRNYFFKTENATMSYDEFSKLLSSHGFEILESSYYGYLPRVGRRLNWAHKYLLLPFEKIGNFFSPLFNNCASSFIIVAKKI